MRSALLLLCSIFVCGCNGTGLAKGRHKGRLGDRANHSTRQEIPPVIPRQNIASDPNKQRGAILERWDGIDGYLVKKMLEDSRFPSMPQYRSYTSTFSEPVNWGDNYGSRISGYFVPQQSGLHAFFIESDNEGELFLSTTDNPDDKILICRVGKDHESLPMQFKKYPEQESYPINLKNGSYYYIEALHKEQYGNDSLSVAVKTPDNKFYAPIPSQFLRTQAPPKHVNETASSTLLLKIAAKAGAKAGASLGMSEAKISGAEAGALAGAVAGQKAGAEAAEEAATKAATEVATKALKEALEKLGKFNKPTFNIYTSNGSVIPLEPGATSTTTQHAGTSEVNETVTITSGVVGGQTSSTGLQGQTSQSVTGQTEAQSTYNATIGVHYGTPGQPPPGHPGIFHGAYVYNRAIPYYIPPKTDNPHEAATAKQFVDSRGLARVIVHNALYVIHAFDIPAAQNPLYNLCWRISNGRLELTQHCQAFLIHIPGFDNGTGEHPSISFESVCAPGHFVRQKNYQFVLGKKGDPNFDFDASAAFYQVFSLPGAFQFSLMRKGWYICRSEDKDYHHVDVVTDYNMASKSWLRRCSFALRPLAANEDPLMNCYGTRPQPKHPQKHGMSAPRAPTNKTTPTTRPTNGTTPTTQPKEEGPCLNFHFWNDAGVPFMLYSSLKPEGYLVTGPEIHLHYVIRNKQVVGLVRLPHKRDQVSVSNGRLLSEVMNNISDSQQLLLDSPGSKIAANQIVKFWAKDPYGKLEILLDGKKVVYAIPGIHCYHHVRVTVTSRPKPVPSTTKPTTLRQTTTSPSPKPTSPPAPPTIRITSPPPPPPTPFPHIHIHLHAPLPPPQPVHPPPPPQTTPEPSPPALAPTKPPPPPKTRPPTTKPTTPPPQCGPDGGSSTARPCLAPTTAPVTTPPPCGLPPCKSKTGSPSLPPCSPGSTSPCRPVPVPPPSPLPIIPSLPCSSPGEPLVPGAQPPCRPPLTALPQVLPVILPTLPPMPTAPSASAFSITIQGCMPTHGGTSHGACCMFPFIYQETPQHRCTRAERGYRWCSTTANYDADKQWGFCTSCYLCYGGNSNGNCCHFPFVYGGKMYTTCTTQDDTKPWCATTYDYDVDKQWGYCGGDAPGSVSQPKIAYPPCSSGCDGMCVDTCPDYCCVKGQTSVQLQSLPPTTQPAQFQQVLEAKQQQHPCPTICAKFCAPDCPVRCCHLSPPASYVPAPPPVPLYCPQICYSTCISSCPADCCSSTQRGVGRDSLLDAVTLPCSSDCYSSCHSNCPPECCKIKREVCKDGLHTVGGNAEGTCCNLPFIYKGAVYWTCTTQDSVKRWCSVNKVFELDKKWGFCI